MPSQRPQLVGVEGNWNSSFTLSYPQTHFIKSRCNTSEKLAGQGGVGMGVWNPGLDYFHRRWRKPDHLANITRVFGADRPAAFPAAAVWDERVIMVCRLKMAL